MTANQKKPDLYLSLPHACSYLHGRLSTIVFVDPKYSLDDKQYAEYLRRGFRRSGDLVYRPHCKHCSACIPVRIPVDRFAADRGQKRVWKKNQDIHVIRQADAMNAEHFALYRRYLSVRHPGSSMDDPDPEKYLSFLTSKQVPAIFYELRAGEQGKLLGVAVTDTLPDGLSAVYTFFDPEHRDRGLGVYAILWQIAEAQRQGLRWLYLGYWIEESPKMAYKTRYHPLEILQNGQWVEFEATQPPPHRSPRLKQP